MVDLNVEFYVPFLEGVSRVIVLQHLQIKMFFYSS